MNPQFPITPGTMYALDKNDEHWLIASPDEDLRLVCVFTPALEGDEALVPPYTFQPLDW